MRTEMKMTDEIKLVKQLAKLNILCVRYVERHTNLICPTWRDVERVITANKLTCTYSYAVDNLYKNIKKLCKNSNYLMSEVIKLKEEIENSNIKELRFGLEPQKKFTELESELDMELTKYHLLYNSDTVEIKRVVELLDGKVTESAIKQACQQERLMNTKKVGNVWLVSLSECRNYWEIPDEDEKALKWEY
jgi:hypothetical protein